MEGCLGELQAATTEFWWRPAWADVPQSETREPGEWRLAVLGFFHPRHPLQEEPDADQPHRSRQAHLRSHSGRNAGVVFRHAPTTVEFTVPPHLFRVLLLERLQLPLPDGSSAMDATSCWTHSEDTGSLHTHRTVITNRAGARASVS